MASSKVRIPLLAVPTYRPNIAVHPESLGTISANSSTAIQSASHHLVSFMRGIPVPSIQR
jgi:hypothetical protein